jgi:hypothetical protein
MKLWNFLSCIRISGIHVFAEICMPHAMQIRQTGGPEVLNWTAVDVGEPGSGQVRLRQAAAGLNYIDVYHRTGYYPQPLPFIPGLEGAGTVEVVAQDVRGLKVGDRVAYAGPTGGYSEVRLRGRSAGAITGGDLVRSSSRDDALPYNQPTICVDGDDPCGHEDDR